MEALDKDPSCIENIYYQEDYDAAKKYLETGEVPEEWAEAEIDEEDVELD